MFKVSILPQASIASTRQTSRFFSNFRNEECELLPRWRMILHCVPPTPKTRCLSGEDINMNKAFVEASVLRSQECEERSAAEFTSGETEHLGCAGSPE